VGRTQFLGHEHFDHRLAQHFGALVTEGALRGGIELRDEAKFVDGDDAVEGGIEHGGRKGAIVVERRYRQSALAPTLWTRPDTADACRRGRLRNHHG